MQDIKPFLKRAWHFLWHEDSVASWIANIVIAFLVIKFIVYPAMGFMLGTTHPIVAVVSNSMEHDAAFEQWWTGRCCASSDESLVRADIYERRRIKREDFKSFSMMNGFNKGDLMILGSAADAKVGDVLVFWSPQLSDPVIHRVIEAGANSNGAIYSTLGDNNCGRQSTHESTIAADKVIGKALLRIPLLGWIKLGFVEVWMAVHCTIAPQSDRCTAWQYYKKAQAVPSC